MIFTVYKECIRSYHKISIVDAMSSFGSVPIAIADAGIDYLITSANKCLHGVPGVAIIFARKAHLDTCQLVLLACPWICTNNIAIWKKPKVHFALPHQRMSC